MPIQRAPQCQPVFQLKSRRSLQQLQLAVGAPAVEAAHPLHFACYTLNVILGGSMSSRLFQSIRERQGWPIRFFRS